MTSTHKRITHKVELAIKELFADTSVSGEQTISSLEAIKEQIDELLFALESDLAMSAKEDDQ